jgi:hypothetical protein
LTIQSSVHGVGNFGAGVQLLAPQYQQRTITVDELSLGTAHKSALFASAPRSAPALRKSATEETVAWAAAHNADESVNVTLVLRERPFEWGNFRNARGGDRAALVQQRQVDLAPVQQPLLSRLAGMQISGVKAHWLANTIDVTVPARLVPQLASWPEVAHLEREVIVQPQGAPGAGYYGSDRRASIHANRLLNQGFDGSEGSALTPASPVRLVDIADNTDRAGNQNYIPENHPGFETFVLSTRFFEDETCGATDDICSSSKNPTTQTHDTVVMGVMAGDITEGQDSRFPGSNTSAQIDRSGIAPGASLGYFRSGSNGTGALVTAIEVAVDSGADVLNNSWNAGTPTATSDPSGLNEVLQNAFNSGVLVVFSAGDSNKGSSFSTSCNVGYPANRPDVLAVNGTNTTYDSSGDVQTNPILAPGAWATSGCPIDVYDGSSGYVAQNDNNIGVSTDGVVGLSYFWDSSTDFGYSGTWTGSSFSAPTVVGAAGLLRHAFHAKGLGVRENFWLKTDLMMLTDGYDFTSYGDEGNVRNAWGTSQYSGTGRLQLRAPDDSSFSGGAWHWSWSWKVFSPGQVVSKTIPADIENYRLAFFWEETDLSHVADIDVYVDALDASGAVCSGNFAMQDDWSIINAIHIKRSDIPSCALPNGKLLIRYLAFAIPPGETRTVYDSDLWDHETGY